MMTRQGRTSAEPRRPGDVPSRRRGAPGSGGRPVSAEAALSSPPIASHDRPHASRLSHARVPTRMLETSPQEDGAAVLERGRAFLKALGYESVAFDDQRPWGGFLVVSEAQARRFIDDFFPGLAPEGFGNEVRLSPKLLLVAPGARLSWQYHHRRSEIWRVLAGRVGVVRSLTDVEGPLQELGPGDQVQLQVEERHRLVGLGGWGLLAEIWLHEDPTSPSCEEDIIRVSDDYGR